jgi:hypothetical protein
MKVLFIDESGDHSLAVIDPQYPVFVLGGVIVDSDYAAGEMAERVRDLKLQLFGTADLVVGPIGRFALGKTTHEGFRIIERKFLRDSEGSTFGGGLVILPKKEG